MKSFISRLAREEFAFTFESYSRMLSSNVDFSEGQKLSTGGTDWKVTSDATNTVLGNGLYAKPITKVYVRDFSYVLDIAQPFRDAISALSGISGSITFDGIGEAEQFTEVVETVSDNIFIDGADCVITCSAGFADLTQLTTYKRINVKNFILKAASEGVGDALKLTFQNVGSNQYRTAKIIEVNIEQDSPTDTNYFKSGITLDNAWKFQISDCNIKGRNGTTSMEHNIKISGQSTDGMIRDTLGYFAHYGFISDGISEGIKLTNATFVYVNRGIVNTPTQKIPAFYLTDVHVNTLQYGIYVTNTDQQMWKGVLVYARAEATGTWRGVYMNDCSNGTFSTITVAGSNTTADKNAFQLEACKVNNFDNIMLIQPKGKVLEDPDCSGNVYTNYRVQSDLDTSRKYIEAGRTSGKSYFNSYQKVSTTFKLSSDRAIPNDEWTGITFDAVSEAYSETGLSYYVSSLMNAIQPIYTGASRYKAWAKFDPSVTGLRTMRLITGDNIVLASITGSPDGNGELYIESAPRNASTNTSVRLEVKQQSGASLDVNDAYMVAEQV